VIDLPLAEMEASVPLDVYLSTNRNIADLPLGTSDLLSSRVDKSLLLSAQSDPSLLTSSPIYESLISAPTDPTVASIIAHETVTNKYNFSTINNRMLCVFFPNDLPSKRECWQFLQSAGVRHLVAHLKIVQQIRYNKVTSHVDVDVRSYLHY
jgi:hypothetical protein